ncbi:MAG: hypothetical protein IBJ11_07445 [Phycisphaerales bacterium]|nr:hypothetical protein [Phycisphaerales bacterium]
MTLSRGLLIAAVVGVAGALAGGLSGCAVAAGAAVIGRAIEEEGSRTVPAMYTGLKGRSFAVVISADRAIQANDPRVVNRLTNAITNRLQGEPLVGASGFVPGPVVLEFQFSTPRWVSWSPGKIAEHFVVDRLVFIELYEYRLQEPGNAYMWDGRAAARVHVLENDGTSDDEFAFSRELRVKYPDNTGVTERDMRREVVGANLEKRLLDRITWLFYTHDEPNKIKY